MNTSQNICCKELALTEFQLSENDELLYYINAGKTRLLLLFINTYNRKSTGDNNKLIRNKKIKINPGATTGFFSNQTII